MTPRSPGTAVVDRPAPRPAWYTRFFRSLRHKNFRLLWIGQALQSEGQWMEQVARGWLLWEISQDPFLLGLYGALRQLPHLALGVPSGILADRVSRVALIQFSQVSACILAFVFAALVQFGAMTPWIILAFAVLNGAAETLRGPARQAMVATSVPGNDLLNAVTVNEVAQYTMRLAGPLIAGAVIAAFTDPFMGVAAVFYVRGLLYLAAVVTTAFIQPPPMPGQPRQRTIRQNLGDTMRYLSDNRAILALAILGAAPGIFGQPYQHLMPVFADIFEVGPFGLGAMSAAVGVGALVGALALAGAGNVGPMGWVLLASLGAYGATIAAFGLSPWFALAMVALLFVGAAQSVFQAVRQTLIQHLVRDEQRGRVMAVNQITRGGLVPVGSVQAGVLAGVIGAPGAVIVLGGMVGLVAVISTLILPGVRRVRYDEEAIS